ncbi:hypothetical protein [Micromonospora sp. NPDC007230]|uniref:hypothetical protein n=1 Tax=Micromonospora sp. NPDC007230 TaxID=3364237 RepID=UPI003681CD49
MDIGQLIFEMNRLHGQAEAQRQHSDHLSQSPRGWAAIQAGLVAAGELLRRSASEIGPEWQDEAGDQYAQRLHRSAAVVQAWQQTLASANLGQALTDLAEAVTTTADEVSKLKQEFDELVGQLANIANGPEAVAEVNRILAQLRIKVEQARQRLQVLDQAFADTAQQVTRALNGTPWDGPQAGGTTAAAAAEATGAAGAQATGAPGGAGAAAGAGGGAGASGGPGAGAGAAGTDGNPGLAGVAAPAPAGLAPGTMPTVPTIPPVATPTTSALPPIVPPIGVRGYRSGRLGGGIPAIAGGPGAAIPRAGRPVSGVSPLAAAPASPPPAPPATGTNGKPGTGAGRLVPPMMMPPTGGGAAGTAPKPGTPDNRDGRHRTRPLRAVPGVPPRLRGRAGQLAGTPAFLAGRSATRRGGEPENTPEQPLDEELWQVETPPAPIVDRRQPH